MKIIPRFLQSLLLLSLALSAILNAKADHPNSRMPNIILIFSDDHGYSDLGIHDIFEDIKTPHIDALAANGVLFTNGYVTAPQCIPSRAGILTGQYQTKFDLESNYRAQKPNGYAGFNDIDTIGERLKAVGYVTGMAGKWHLGPFTKITDHGFDKVYARHGEAPATANMDLQGNDRDLGPLKSERYHIDACSDAATAFIQRHHDSPFFYYLAYRAPHVPLDAPPKYLKRFPGKMPERRRQALAMIAAMDDGVGTIMNALRKYDIEEKTLIFFIGDNGAPLKIEKADKPGGGPGWDGSLNDPMKGEKGMLSEGGIRVPFVAYWKNAIPGGQIYNHPVISLDVAATAVTEAGLPHDPELDGVNLMPFLSGKINSAPHENLFWRWEGQAAIREGKWKYIRAGEKLEYLFNLEKDPQEMYNLLRSRRKHAMKLKAKLEKWGSTQNPKGLGGELPKPGQNFFDHYFNGQ